MEWVKVPEWEGINLIGAEGTKLLHIWQTLIQRHHTLTFYKEDSDSREENFSVK